VDVKERTVRDRLVTRLKDLDLPTNEALTYITLLTHSAMTASAICKETSIPDSKIYYALDDLSRKGMITVQKGNPNIYLPTPPQEAIANLKNQLMESVNEKISEADALVNVLMPIYENAEKSEEFEVAYIIRGQKNIINRMKALIDTARKEITFFTSFPSVLKELRDSLIEAKEKRRVKLNIALTQEVYRKEGSSDLGEVRLLCCSAESTVSSLGMLISDMKTLLTLSDLGEETAMLTQDKNLIRVTRDYFDSPTCCTIM
jgi:sugar-specific transcriptional regulator TrmB